jgi:membrane protein implicated in regulation of membrane protease activity
MSTLTNFLMQELKFTPEDLEANRRGELSPSQKERIQISKDFNRRLAEASGKTSPLAVGLLILLLLVAGGLVYFFLREEVIGVMNSLGSAALPVGLVIVALVVLLLLYAQRSLRQSREMVAAWGAPGVALPRVQVVTGKVQVTREMWGEPPDETFVHYLVVRDRYDTKKISVPEKALDAFDIGYNYGVFYYEEGGVLSFLSAEVMQS